MSQKVLNQIERKGHTLIGLLIDCAKGIIKERNKEGIEMKSKMIRNLFLILGGISVLLLGSCSWNSIPKNLLTSFHSMNMLLALFLSPKGQKGYPNEDFFH